MKIFRRNSATCAALETPAVAMSPIGPESTQLYKKSVILLPVLFGDGIIIVF
jgi:hypothetical protein